MTRFWRASRNESLTDIASLPPRRAFPPGIRLWAARRAAARGLGASGVESGAK